MPGSAVWQCHGCGDAIDPDAEVLRLVRYDAIDLGDDSPVRNPVPRFVHVGHEGTDLTEGFRVRGHGTLRDLLALDATARQAGSTGGAGSSA